MPPPRKPRVPIAVGDEYDLVDDVGRRYPVHVLALVPEHKPLTDKPNSRVALVLVDPPRERSR
jgi:hypothetical protein